jgi:hypothetical protein
MFNPANLTSIFNKYRGMMGNQMQPQGMGQGGQPGMAQPPQMSPQMGSQGMAGGQSQGGLQQLLMLLQMMQQQRGGMGRGTL